MRKIFILVFAGVLASTTQGLAQKRNGSSQIDGFSPPARASRHGYWSTPEGKQAAVEIQYQQAQQAFEQTYAQGAIPRTDAALAQYQRLMVLYTRAMENFGINTGHAHPPFAVIADRPPPITDQQLKQDYGVVLRDYFSGIRLFGLGTAWTRPSKPPGLPPIENTKDPEYIAYAKALQTDDALVEKFANRVYAAALQSRLTPPPFPLRDNRPVVAEEQRWCEIDFGATIGRVPC